MTSTKMKKITLYAARGDKEDILRTLMLLGCVEVSEPDEQINSSDVFARESADTERLRADHASILRGIEIINQHTPRKKTRAKTQEQVKSGDLLDGIDTQSLLELARNLEALDDKIRALKSEGQVEKSFIDLLTPWAGFDIPLDNAGTDNAALILGEIPRSANVKTEELCEAVPESEVFVVSMDAQRRYLAVVYLWERLAEVSEVLGRWGFTVASFEDAHGTADDNIKRSQERLGNMTEEIARLVSQIESAANREDDLKLCYDHIGTKITRAEAAQRMAGTQFVVALTGWLPADREPEVIVALSKYQCALDIRDPSPDEADAVPVMPSRFFSKARKGGVMFEPLAIDTRYVSTKNESAQGG